MVDLIFFPPTKTHAAHNLYYHFQTKLLGNLFGKCTFSFYTHESKDGGMHKHMSHGTEQSHIF